MNHPGTDQEMVTVRNWSVATQHRAGLEGDRGMDQLYNLRYSESEHNHKMKCIPFCSGKKKKILQHIRMRSKMKRAYYSPYQPITIILQPQLGSFPVTLGRNVNLNHQQQLNTNNHKPLLNQKSQRFKSCQIRLQRAQ